MDNQTQIKEIIAGFVQLDAAQITDETVIDRSAIRSSILVHRMYAALADAGLPVGNPSAIRTFGDLRQLTGAMNDSAITPVIRTIRHAVSDSAGVVAVGIDIEDISNFVEVPDFREDSFYKENFSPAEIAWCIMQPHPLASFCGKFAAKEAIVKADNDFRAVPFNQIEIVNSDNGKPRFDGFEISISHTDSTSVAVAICMHGGTTNQQATGVATTNRNLWLWLVALAALFLALASHLIH